jgi:hypothetical protein
MKIYDTVKKEEIEISSEQDLVNLMTKDGRQIDLYFEELKTDEDGYMSWNKEHWSSLDGRKFIRYYTLNDRVLNEFTGHNIDDLKNDFKPTEAYKIELS